MKLTKAGYMWRYKHISCFSFYFEVISKNISWEKANKYDWRKNGDWKPGWEYDIDSII